VSGSFFDVQIERHYRDVFEQKKTVPYKHSYQPELPAIINSLIHPKGLATEEPYQLFRTSDPTPYIKIEGKKVLISQEAITLFRDPKELAAIIAYEIISKEKRWEQLLSRNEPVLAIPSFGILFAACCYLFDVHGPDFTNRNQKKEERQGKALPALVLRRTVTAGGAGALLGTMFAAWLRPNSIAKSKEIPMNDFLQKMNSPLHLENALLQLKDWCKQRKWNPDTEFPGLEEKLGRLATLKNQNPDLWKEEHIVR